MPDPPDAVLLSSARSATTFSLLAVDRRHIDARLDGPVRVTSRVYLCESEPFRAWFDKLVNHLDSLAGGPPRVFESIEGELLLTLRVSVVGQVFVDIRIGSPASSPESWSVQVQIEIGLGQLETWARRARRVLG